MAYGIRIYDSKGNLKQEFSTKQVNKSIVDGAKAILGSDFRLPVFDIIPVVKKQEMEYKSKPCMDCCKPVVYLNNNKLRCDDCINIRKLAGERAVAAVARAKRKANEKPMYCDICKGLITRKVRYLKGKICCECTRNKLVFNQRIRYLERNPKVRRNTKHRADRGSCMKCGEAIPLNLEGGYCKEHEVLETN